MQRIGHLESGSDYKVRVRYTAETCGDHDIYMKVGRNGQLTDAAKAVETVNVPCLASNPPTTDIPNSDPPPSAAANDDGCNATGGSTEGFWSSLVPMGAVLAGLLGRRKKKSAGSR